MDIVGFLYGFGVLQGLILAAVLVLAPSGHRVANGFMAALVLAIALNLLQSWLIRAEFYMDHPAGALLIPPLDFVWGPLLFLYAYTLTAGELRWYYIAHFLPAAAILLGSQAAFGDSSQEEKRAFVQYLWSSRTDETLAAQFNAMKTPFWGAWVDYHVQGSLFSIHFGGYCALVLQQIQRHNRRLERHFSSMEDMNLRWLRHLTWSCLLFLLIFLMFNRAQLLTVGHFDVNALQASAPSIFLVLLVYVIGISAYFQPSLFRGVSAARDSDPRTTAEAALPDNGAAEPAIQVSDTTEEETAREEGQPEQKEKYQRSAISLEDANRYKMQLMKVMQEQKLYLDSELTLPDLARETGLAAHHISQVINGQMNQNFFSFVNSYRIGLAKELLTKPDSRDMPIVELAFEVGFKSKSSFYDAFKKATEMTPTQFKKNTPPLSS